MSDKKYTSITNYTALAAHLGLTKDAVLAAKETQQLDIMDLESVVAYICSVKGWFFSKNTTAALEGQRGPFVPPVVLQKDAHGKIVGQTEHAAILDVATDPHAGSTVRWKVTDNQKKDLDPYLSRTKVLRGK